jgi:amino-acid N-acetyltransferase
MLWPNRIDRLIYRDACLYDLKEIKGLLESYDLPSIDVEEHVANFVVAESNGKIIGVGGFERCEDFGLLRSFAVTSGQKGRGIADHLFSLVKAKAVECGIGQFYLLTTTADKYFDRHGFVVCNRDTVPDQIKATRQFSELCPCSAVVMVSNLCS